MKGFALGLSLSIAFILGCAAAPLIVPRMSAQQQAAGVQRWDYKCDEVRWRRATETLQEFGQEGWELVTSEQGTYCFKRPL